jgi:protein involved in polysaccharide export with SLBB domain
MVKVLFEKVSNLHQQMLELTIRWINDGQIVLRPRWMLLIVFKFLLLSGASGLVAQETMEGTLPAPAANEAAYKLGPGDRIRINVFNHDELSGEYQLDSECRFSMPLIDVVEADDLNSAELEALLVAKIKPDYLVNPRIFIQLVTYRPYYLVGEVGGRGAFPYIAGMTYLKAVAIAGGFTYRAKKEYVFVVRADDPEQNEIKLSVNEKVQPGDIIRVAERIF